MDWTDWLQIAIISIGLILGVVNTILKWFRNIESEESFKSKLSKLIIGTVIGVIIIVCGIIFGFINMWLVILTLIIASLFPSIFIAHILVWLNNGIEFIDIKNENLFKERTIYIFMAIISSVLIAVVVK